eukprot:jgi/Bigna1/135286/aug1.28_g9994
MASSVDDATRSPILAQKKEAALSPSLVSSSSTTSFAETVASLVMDAYDKLERRGKPQRQEWTVLAGIIRTHECGESGSILSSDVISIATGTKCVGRKNINPNGETLNDLHAESLVRRAFVRYLLEDIRKAAHRGGASQSENFVKATQVENIDSRGETAYASPPPPPPPPPQSPPSPSSKDGLNKRQCYYRIADGIRFHLFISQPPCGDASIYHRTSISKTGGNSEERKELGIGNKRKKPDSREGIVDEPSSSSSQQQQEQRQQYHQQQQQQHPNLNQTGAKILLDDDSINLRRTVRRVGREDVQRQLIGVPRLKSGRSDIPKELRTLSMSCSDKIAKWLFCGCQGGLLANLITGPIKISTIVVSKPHNASVEVKKSGLDSSSSSSSSSSNYGSRSTRGKSCSSTSSLESKKKKKKDEKISTPPRLLICNRQYPRSLANIRNDYHSHSKETSRKNKRIRSESQHDKEQIKRRKGEMGRKVSNDIRRSPSACGLALNWYKGGAVEVLGGTTGRKQGANMRQKSIKTCSRLCKAALWTLFRDVYAGINGKSVFSSYFEAKSCSRWYRELKSDFKLSMRQWVRKERADKISILSSHQFQQVNRNIN